MTETSGAIDAMCLIPGVILLIVLPYRERGDDAVEASIDDRLNIVSAPGNKKREARHERGRHSLCYQTMVRNLFYTQLISRCCWSSLQRDELTPNIYKHSSGNNYRHASRSIEPISLSSLARSYRLPRLLQSSAQ